MAAVAKAVLPAGPAAIERAAAALAAGRLVAFPTETVYGLGADATNDVAVARLYAAKERPSFNPLIAHVANDVAVDPEGPGPTRYGRHTPPIPGAAAIDAASRLARFDADALRLAAAFWPGPLTLVLPRLPGCPVGQLATAGLDTIAVRAPSHPVARAILAAFGKPVVAPSANRSGQVSPTSAQHVEVDLAGRVDLIIDGGAAPMGVESTVLACSSGGEVALLRPGAIPRAAVERVLGRPVVMSMTAGDAAGLQGTPRPPAPGMLASHYAPRAMVRLNAVTVAPDEALLAFGADVPPDAGRARVVLNLSSRGDLVEAAANLFGHLRLLDSAGVASIAVMPMPDEGLGEAINDRLRHAAAPRSDRPHDSTASGDSDIFRAGITT